MPRPAGRERATSTRGKTPHKPASRRDAAVLPRSLVVQPASRARRRKPLEKSRLAMAARAKPRTRTRPRAQADESAFYLNIWTPPAARAGHKPRRFVDISQVAHVLTTLDYKAGYEAGDDANSNIWAAPHSQQDSLDVQASVSGPRLSGLSDDVISEQESESDMQNDPATTALSLGPLRMSSSALRSELASDARVQAAVGRTPVSRPQRKGPRVVYSSVLAAGDEVDRSWNAQFLLGLHEPVRHALYVMDRFLLRSLERAATAEPDWHAGAFFLWFKLHFVEFVKNQHDVKTAVLLPLVVVRFADKREVLACYEAVYVLLDAVLAHEHALGASVPASARHTRLKALQTDIRHLNALLLNVLALEEQTLKPAIAQAFSEHAFQRYVMPRVLRASKPKRVVLPWIVERCRVWGGAKTARAYRDDLPFTARFLYDHVWQPYFVANVASAMTHLDGESLDSPTDDSDDSWFGCAVM